jgi:glycosyltransferase involved in cell wall biosynthesis
MRILINGLVVNRGGHQTYFSNLIPYLGKLGQDHEFLLLHSPWQREMFDFRLPNNFSRIIRGPERRSVFRRTIWEQIFLPRLLRNAQVDLMFSPTPATAIISPCPTVIAVRNTNLFAPLSVRDFHYLARNSLLRLVTQITVRRASSVIFVSDYSRKIAERALRLDPKKSSVIYHGVGPNFLRRGTESSRIYKGLRPYILTVSTIQIHKNYPRMIEAFGKLHKVEEIYDYVFAGAVEVEGEFSRIKEKIRKIEVEDRVHYLGEVQYKDLPDLYAGASLFILPSLLESFGHPLVEAMASGIPIVASNVAAIPEICSDAAIYFDPNDADEIANTILRVLHDNDLRNSLIQNGIRRVKRFSWAETARQMLNLFTSAVGQNG